MNEITKAIKDCAAKRADGVAIPLRAPVGWVHLSVAMAKIAHAILGDDENSWQDALVAVIAGSIDDANGVPPDNVLASEVGAYICDQIAEICRTETLITGFRKVGGASDVAVMPGEWWDTEDPELRFRTFSVDPENLTSSRIDLPCWIWVDAASLENQIERIERWKRKRPVRGVYEGEWGSLADAVQLVAERVGGGSYETFLRIASKQGTWAVAGEMVRSFKGKLVERDLHWPIPCQMWACVDPMDPARRLEQGNLRAISGPSVWVLSSVRVDLLCLRETLDEHFPVKDELHAPAYQQGTLPAHATRANQKAEAAAHNVAKIVRSQGCSVSEGIRQSRHLVLAENRDQETIDRGIREAFNLMYSKHGQPIQK